MKTSVKITSVVILLFQVSSGSWAQTWQIQEIGRGAKPTIGIDFFDQIHFAYLDERFADGYIEHATIVNDTIQKSNSCRGVAITKVRQHLELIEEDLPMSWHTIMSQRTRHFI